MNYEYLTNMPLEQALEQYLQRLYQTGLSLETEKIAIGEACGRITAEAVYAAMCSPHYNSCAMDGIALQANLTFGATETTPVTLDKTQYIIVDTGDPLPAHCDCVVMIEDVVRDGDKTVLYQAAVPWQNVRQIGEDICQGDMLLPSYTKITPAAAGALIAGGVLQVPVLSSLQVGIIPTGDEIISPCTDPAPGEILEFNSTIFSGMLQEWNAAPKVYPIVRDRLEEITAALAHAAVECHIVLINAGSSAGREDYSSTAIQKLGQVICHGIAMKPGKPAILGLIGSTPVIGVPGYPVSGIIVLEHIVKPLIQAFLRQPKSSPETAEAVLSKRLMSSLKYKELIRTRIGAVNGRLVAVPLNRGAGVVTSFVRADGILEIPQNLEGIEAGKTVRVQLMKSREELEKTVVITGSHDPLIDEAADLLKRNYPDAAAASSHVGSMGGIMAIRRGEAHMAGIHLLDEETGEYNHSYVTKYFPGGGVVLKPCVRRIQGFITAKGNPRGIRRWQDIANGKLSYVNRQKGSGTRILCDFLLKKEGLAPGNIYGYEREEYTHTNVAAIIAAGSADVGLGIYSAARIYDLEFIPICEEQYDFLLAESALTHPQVEKFLTILSSQSFRERLSALGGYKV